MSVSILEIKYKTESSGLSDVTIPFAGNVPSSGSAFKQCTIGEYVTAEIKYRLNVGNLDNYMVYYDFGLSVPFVPAPVNETRAYNIYCAASLSIGTYYTMNLFIDGTATQEVFEQNNQLVRFKRTSSTEFTIEHSFYMTMDMMQSLSNLTGFAKKYRLTKSTWFTPSEFTNLDGTMYNSSSPRFAYHGVMVRNVNTYHRQSVIPIQAKFWNKGVNNGTPYYSFNNATITDLLGTPLTAFSNVNASKINFFIDHAGLAPTVAIIRYMKYNTFETLSAWSTQIDLQTVSATITAVSGTQSKITATIPALPIGDYMVYDIVYRSANTYVQSHNFVCSSVGEVCQPYCNPRTNNYEAADLQCSEYSPIERIALRMIYGKTTTGGSITTSFNDCCMAIYGRNFDDCKRSVTLDVFDGTNVVQQFQAFWNGTNWIGNFDSINDDPNFLGLNARYRIPASLAGLDVSLNWYLELDFGTFTETILYEDNIRVKAFEPDVVFTDITLKDPQGNVITNICDVDEYVEVEVCKTGLDDYRIVGVLQKDVTFFENDSFAAGTTSLPRMTDVIMFDVDTGFTGGCASFKIDASLLEYDYTYNVYLIGYKI